MSCRDNRPKPVALDWAQLVRRFARFDEVSDKLAAKAWSPASFGGARKSENVRIIGLLVLDFDDHSEDDVRRVLRGLRAVVHSTFSYTVATPRCFRAVVPLSRPVDVVPCPSLTSKDSPPTAEQLAAAALCPFRRVWAHAAHATGGDPKCKDPGRLYFVPCHAPGNPTVAFSLHGEPYDVDAALAAVHRVDLGSPAAGSSAKGSERGGVTLSAAEPPGVLPDGFWERIGAERVEVARDGAEGRPRFTQSFTLAQRRDRFAAWLRGARPSVSGQGRAFGALQHVIYAALYGFLLPPAELQRGGWGILEPWNARCTNGATGAAYPWTMAELDAALAHARRPDPRYFPGGRLGHYLKQPAGAARFVTGQRANRIDIGKPA